MSVGSCSHPDGCKCWGAKWNMRTHCRHFIPPERLPPFVEPPPNKVWFDNRLVYGRRQDGRNGPPPYARPATPPGPPGARSSSPDAGEAYASAEDAVDGVISECLEVYNVMRTRFDGKTFCLEDREGIARAILLTAANLWGIGRD
jgi:hypothetical protein